MKYQVKQGDHRYSIDIDGKYDYSHASPVLVDKKAYEVLIDETDANGDMRTVMINRKVYRVSITRGAEGFPEEVVLKGVPYRVEIDKIESTRYRPDASKKEIPGTVEAAMPGQIVHLLIQEGQAVEKGQVVLIQEAMKMENEILAPKSGKLRTIHVKPKDLVMKGDLLFEVE